MHNFVLISVLTKFSDVFVALFLSLLGYFTDADEGKKNSKILLTALSYSMSVANVNTFICVHTIPRSKEYIISVTLCSESG